MSNSIAAIILAAGSSTRLGRPKQLVEFEGQPLVRRAVDSAADAGVGSIFVVTGAFADEVGSAVRDADNVTIIFNPKWTSGLASSLATGLEAAQVMNCDGALVLTADQPLIDSGDLKMLVDAFDDRHRIIAASYDQVIGVPALFGAEYFQSLMELRGDEGAGRWLRARSSEVTRIPMDNASLDIDTPDDVDRLESRNVTSAR